MSIFLDFVEYLILLKKEGQSDLGMILLVYFI